MGGNGWSPKKLEDAGVWLGTPVEKQPAQLLERLEVELEDAVFMGLDRETYKASQIEREGLDESFELFEENLESFNLFNELHTQRNYVAGQQAPILIGLDYTGVMTYLRTQFSRKKSGYILEDLKAIEQGFVRAKNEQTRAKV